MTDTVLTIFQTTIVQSCKAGLAIGAIFFFLAVAGRRLSPATRYLLWMLVPLALLFCVSIRTPLSVYNLLPDHVTEPREAERHDAFIPANDNLGHASTELETQEVLSDTSPLVLNEATSTRETAAWTRPDVFSMTTLSLVWLCGCCVMALVFLRQGLVCRRWIRQGKQVTDQRVLTIFEQCAKQMKVGTWLVVAESPAVSGPFLIGAVRPTLLLPEALARNATEKQLRTVFLHELAHLKRWDVWVAWLMTLLLILHWFNPLLWLALRRLNDAREEACDVLALEKLDQTERKFYGLSLVDMTAQYQSPKRMPGLVGISENGRFLTRRIEMIRQIGTWKPRWGVIAALFALVVGIVTITDAQQPSKPGNIVVNGVEYAPVEKETTPKTEETRPAVRSQKPELSPEWAAVLGDYIGTEGDDRIGMTIKKAEKKVFPEKVSTDPKATFSEGSFVLLPYVQVVIYDDGLPNQGREKDDDIYYGELTAVEGDTLTIAVEKYLDDNKQEKPVPKAIQKLTAKIVRSGEKTTLEIPKNREWDAIKVTKVVKTPAAKPAAETVKDVSQSLSGRYFGSEGDDRIGMIIASPKDGVYPITIYEDGLPGMGFDTRDDDYYTGTATLKTADTLEIALSKKFDEGREERVEAPLQKLTAKVTELGVASNDDKIFTQTSLKIEIPANREWDAITMQRQQDETR